MSENHYSNIVFAKLKYKSLVLFWYNSVLYSWSHFTKINVYIAILRIIPFNRTACMYEEQGQSLKIITT